jgi:hypothetical protein
MLWPPTVTEELRNDVQFALRFNGQKAAAPEAALQVENYVQLNTYASFFFTF